MDDRRPPRRNARHSRPDRTRLLIFSLLAGIALGSVRVSPIEIWRMLYGAAASEATQIIYNIRLPRVLSGACVGVNLAVAGCIMRGIFSNPLADSSTTGISSGAGFAAMATMILFPSQTYLAPALAFAGAMLTMAIVFTMAWKEGLSPLRLILSGMIASSFFGALTSVLLVLFQTGFSPWSRGWPAACSRRRGRTS